MTKASREDGSEGAQPEEHSVNFLSDETVADDFFGSHKRVADAVAVAIRTMGEPGVIGVLGPWGSGKSTVVRLVTDQLFSTHRVFTYDAWLHQSDPPRRSFLEQFRGFLVANGFAAKDARQAEFDTINRRTEVTTTESTPHLTKSGGLLLLTLAAVPFSTRFLGVDWAKVTYNSPADKLQAWVFPLSLLISILPLLVALAMVGWQRLCRRNNASKHSILNLVVNRQVSTQTSRVTKTPEPTTIEFQELFRTLLRDAASKGAKLVIVVDNLDRIREEEAVEMWNTIRSFFLGALPNREKAGTINSPTVLLPLDPHGIARLYKEDDKDADQRLVRSFMDKTFDVVFHVSAPWYPTGSPSCSMRCGKRSEKPSSTAGVLR
jgi:hypothetical protein